MLRHWSRSARRLPPQHPKPNQRCRRKSVPTATEHQRQPEEKRPPGAIQAAFLIYRDKLKLTTEGDSVTLRPVRSSSRLRKERGVWVFRTGGKLTAADTDKVLRETRAERSQAAREEQQ